MKKYVFTILILLMAGTGWAYDIIIDNVVVTRGHLATISVDVHLLTSGVTNHSKTVRYSANKQDANWKDDMKTNILNKIFNVNISQMAEDTWQASTNVKAITTWLKGQVE